MSSWRVMAVQDQDTFLHDQVKIFMARKDDDGFRMVMPLEFTLSGPISDTETHMDPAAHVKPSVIPRELAEQLCEQLTYILLDVADPVMEIRRLRRELTESKRMLTLLIESIGKIGGASSGK